MHETLMTREERLRSEDMGDYYRVAADNRDLNYDKFVTRGELYKISEGSYTSYNAVRLSAKDVIKKLMTTNYVREALGLF